MGTGSEPVGVPDFRKRLDIVPDSPEELQADGVVTFLEVSRSAVCLLTMDGIQRKALSFQQFEFPYCRDDARWAAIVGQVLKEANVSKRRLTIVDSIPISIIPTDLFPRSEDDLQAILNLEHRASENQYQLDTPLEVWDARCVALIPEGLKNELSGNVIPAISAWIPSLIRKPTGHHIHLHISERTFRLAVLKGKELILHNVFEYSAHEDVLYFTMATLEQLSILHTEAGLVLYGAIAKGDGLHELFSRYVSDVRFGEKPTELTYSYAFKDLEGHAFPFILNAPLCASYVAD